MTRKEAVKRAIKMQNPGRIPMFVFNEADYVDPDTDILKITLEDWYLGEKGDWTEWGFFWDRDPADPTSMGVPRDVTIKEWDQLEEYKKTLAPNPYREDRWKAAKEVDVGDRYLIGTLYLTGFTVMSFLRGFENLLVDFYEEPEKVRELAELVFGIENEIIKQMPKYGFSGVMLFDDWGSQRAMLISPEMWRDIFKPFYKEQFRIAHEAGIDIYFHTCGMVYPIIGDLIECGADMIHLGQADLNDPEKSREEYRGKVCFVSSINYQTTGITGTKEEIYAEARDIMRCFGTDEGGLIALVFDYESMGWKTKYPDNGLHTKTAFLDQAP